MEATALSPRRVAELCGVHYNTIYREIHRGTLPAYRIGSGKCIRIFRADWEAWLRERRV